MTPLGDATAGEAGGVEHRRGSAALTFGILGLVLGAVTCGAGLVLSPIALVLGREARRDMARHPGTEWSNAGEVRVAVRLAWIGTVLLACIVVFGGATLLLYWSGRLRVG